MCDDGVPGGVRRGTVLGGVAALVAGAATITGGTFAALTGSNRAHAADASRADVLPVAVAPGVSILPREAWGADLPPRGPSYVEQPRFLLVHHTASTSAYRDARDVIRSTYAFHTSSVKGWPDVCYEFFVGRDGDVWEGRAGALHGPVIADATGGSQGFAQLACLLGDFSVAPPTDAALDALTGLFAWLSRRDGIDVTPGATTSFVSRGSDRWPAGSAITTPTIAGHRDMTFTNCPGDAMYALLPTLREQVHARRGGWERAVTEATPGPDGLRPATRLGVVDTP